jgi:Icc protein
LKLIAIVTDLHLGEDFPKEHGVDASKRWNIILDDIKKRNVNQIVINGDIGDKPSNFMFFNELKFIGIPFTLTLGNHDFYEEAIKYFYRNNPNNDNELYYAEEDEENKFIYLDSLSAQISINQINWFEQQLNTNKKVFLFVHHPVLPVPTAVDVSYPLQNRSVIADILFKQNKNITICCGHYHLEHDQTIHNVRQLITPAASVQIQQHPETVIIDTSRFGYRLLLIRNNTIQTNVVWFTDGNE